MSFRRAFRALSATAPLVDRWTFKQRTLIALAAPPLQWLVVMRHSRRRIDRTGPVLHPSLVFAESSNTSDTI